MGHIRTVGELVEELQKLDQTLPVGVYTIDSEEGGLFIDSVSIQDRNVRNTMRYYKSENPLSPVYQAGLKDSEGYPLNITKMVTINGYG